MPGVAVDGNDVFAVWLAMKEATERARAGEGPTLIEAKTYRTVGHHEGDPVVGTYRTQEEIDAWVKRDPIDMFRKRLVEDYGVADADDARRRSRRRSTKVVQEALEFARNSPEPDPATVRRHVYADPINPPEALRPRAVGETRTQGWLERCATASPRRCGANPRHPLFRRRHRRARRHLRPHQEPLAGVRRRAHGRHADLRAGLHRRRRRRLGHRRAHRRRT